jgi:hypothetical protein
MESTNINRLVLAVQESRVHNLAFEDKKKQIFKQIVTHFFLNIEDDYIHKIFGGKPDVKNFKYLS